MSKVRNKQCPRFEANTIDYLPLRTPNRVTQTTAGVRLRFTCSRVCCHFAVSVSSFKAYVAFDLTPPRPQTSAIDAVTLGTRPFAQPFCPSPSETYVCGVQMPLSSSWHLTNWPSDICSRTICTANLRSHCVNHLPPVQGFIVGTIERISLRHAEVWKSHGIRHSSLTAGVHRQPRTYLDNMKLVKVDIGQCYNINVKMKITFNKNKHYV